jgi:hypothetical protein
MLRAKFLVEDRQETFGNDDQKVSENISMRPVYSDDPASENGQFWNATPSGSIQLFITNPDAFDKLIAGDEFYVDFSPAGSE